MSSPAPPRRTSSPPAPSITSSPPRPSISSLPDVPVSTSSPGVPMITVGAGGSSGPSGGRGPTGAGGASGLPSGGSWETDGGTGGTPPSRRATTRGTPIILIIFSCNPCPSGIWSVCPKEERKVLDQLRAWTAAAALVASLGAAASATAAPYDTGFRFSQYEDGGANVAAQGPSVPAFHHLDVVRSGAVVATSPPSPSFASLDVRTLLAGDIARYYDGNTIRATASYDGLPAIAPNACAGRTTFTATRTSSHAVSDAGAYPGGNSYALNRAIFTQDNPFTVTLTSPLVTGDTVFVATQGLQTSGAVGVES